MDARGWEFPQSHQASAKRPWGEQDPAVLPPRSNLWNGVTLPPLEPAPYRRQSAPLVVEPATITIPSSRYTNDPAAETAAKRPRREGSGYSSSFRDGAGLINEGIRQAQLQSPFPPHRGSLDRSPGVAQQRQEWERGVGLVGGEAGDRPAPNLSGLSSLCPRCRRLTTQPPRNDLAQESNHEKETTSNPEATLAAQRAAEELTKVLNTLSLGISARHGMIRHHNAENQSELFPDTVPIAAQQDLRQTLGWILERLCLVNELADKLVHNAQSPNPQHMDHDLLRNSASAQDDPHYSMKRHLDGSPIDGYRKMADDEASTDSKLYTRRKSVMAIPNPEDLPSMRSNHEYHPFHSSTGGISRRHSIMNPPPAPNRHLPPSPGHSLPSPTSANFPSPSGASSYGGSSQSTNLHPPAPHASSGTPYPPPIGAADTALQAHSAALQHEVSVQKIALSSLQGEHDKLLAAFSRSQTRASALEKKHTVSDNEIVNLAEEKIRLQSQVADLEKDVEDLTRSRDEARQSAVQEGAQYVEIVKKATQLEELAADERRKWGILKAEMEQKIILLTQGNLPESSGANNESSSTTTPAAMPGNGNDEMDISSSSRFEGQPPDVKIEPSSPTASRSFGSRPEQIAEQHDSSRELKSEIQRLRSRCAEVEATLRAVREDSKSVEGIVHALEMARRSILERADLTLGDDNDQHHPPGSNNNT